MEKIKQLFVQSKLDSVDLGYALLTSSLLMLLTNLGHILDSFDVPGSRQILQSNLGRVMTDFLSKLDDFEFTKTAVLFLFWAFIGFVLYLLIQSLLNARNELEYDAEVSSDEYIHPESFDSKKYWEKTIEDKAVVLGLTVTLVAFVLLVLVVGLPFAQDRAAKLFDTISIQSLLLTVLGFLVLLFFTSLAIFGLKLLKNRSLVQ